jgi:kynureninase
MPLPADRFRQEFPALETGIHLLSHSLGPVPRATRRALGEYADLWERQIREDVWADHWWDLSRDVGDLIARVLGGRPGTVQIQPNTSIALASVISCLNPGDVERRKVVTSGLDFPTTGYIWEAQRRTGFEAAIVPSEDGLTTPLDRLLESIDDRTALVALSHVSYRSSHRVDPVPIVERAHRAGALVLLDCYQSAGIVEMDADRWGVDFLIGGTIKWLCGGPACGYLYVRPGLIPKLEPRLTGWFAHAEPFAFEHAPMKYADTVRRFAQGTANIPGLYSCREGLRIVLQVGLGTIAAESRRRTSWLVEAARTGGFRVNSPASVDDRGGVVMIDVEDPGAVALRLRERGVLVDWRPGVGLRVGPHFFNTDEEVHRFMEILAEVRS